jgi:deoxyribonuclease IV
MLKPQKLNFGTAGIPISTQKPSTINGILRVKELNLDAMELEFVRGVNIKENIAKEINLISKNNNIILTTHAPYYINLNSIENQKINASIDRIIQTAKIANIAGAYSVVFHASYYGKTTKEQTYNQTKKSLTEIIQTLKDNNINIWIRPETMGKKSQFGTLEETISLSEQLDMVLPCIDFSHMHAREGKYNTQKEIEEILTKIENHLGKTALNNMHIHLQGIEYGEKGEKKHLNLKESDMNYTSILKVLKNWKTKGVIISESPNIENDALLLKKTYEYL